MHPIDLWINLASLLFAALAFLRLAAVDRESVLLKAQAQATLEAATSREAQLRRPGGHSPTGDVEIASG